MTLATACSTFRPTASLRAMGRLALAGLGLWVAAGPAVANDFPTAERVIYVQECLRQHPGPNFEMVSKCSCALDRIARDVSFSDYETMATAANANSIGGERGNVIRDTEVMQVQIRKFRELQANAKKACFINLDAK